jgi:23S rRNA pseudouridine2605 synthase
MAKERLQKILASAGVDSRRKCEELILEGVVRVNRRVVDQLPAFADADQDTITVNSKRIRSAAKVYYLLNKPKGVICTNADPQGRRKAIDYVPNSERVFCAGRLDADTTGLIIVTNDSVLANRLTHPRYGLAKRYVATVKGSIEASQIEKLRKGIWLAEGKTSGASSLKVLKRGPRQSSLEIVLKQGLNRQVRRMLAAVGLDVKALKRVRIGRITDRGVGAGRYRALGAAEVAYLHKATARGDADKGSA